MLLPTWPSTLCATSSRSVAIDEFSLACRRETRCRNVAPDRHTTTRSAMRVASARSKPAAM